MDSKILNIANELIEATDSNKILWAEIENTFCIESSYQNRKIVLCKYPDPQTKKDIVSFNFLDENDYVIEPFNQLRENEDGYLILVELYSKACKKTLAPSC